MQTLQQTTIDALNAPGREFESRLDLVTWSGGTETVTASYGSGYIIDWTIDESAGTDGSVMVGAVTAAKLTLRLNGGNMYKQSPQFFNFPQRQKMRLYLRAKLTGGEFTEWIPLGAYYCDDVKRKSWVVTVTAYDAMVLTDVPYNSTLKFPAQANAVIKDIADTIGFSYVLDDSKDFSIVEKPENKTCREVLGQIASANLCNARLNREGKFIMQTILRQSPITVGVAQVTAYDFSDDAYSVKKVKIESRGTVYEYGSGTAAFSFKNELLNKVQRDLMMSSLGFSSFYTGCCEMRGDLRIEPGDFLVVSVPFMSGTRQYPISVVDQQLYFNGGLKQSIKSSFQNDLQTETSSSQMVASGTANGLNYAVFSKLPNVMPELEHNTLVCELGEIQGDGVNNITDGQIGSNGDYTLYNLQNVYLYKKQVAYVIAHTPAVNFYTEAAQAMEEIIIPKKLRAYCGHNIRPNMDYEDFVTVQFMWVTVGSAATFDYDTISADDRNFKVYDGLAVCKRLIIPDNGKSFTIEGVGNCPKLEEIVFECDVGIINNGALAYCPNLHTIRFEKSVHDGFPYNIENVPEIFLPHDFGTESNPYTSLLTNENTAAEKITYHTRGLKHLGGRDGYAWFQGGANNKVKEIVVPEGTQVFHSNSFSNMPELECVTFPGYYQGHTYAFVGPLLEQSGETYPIFYNCPNLKKFRCRQSQSDIIKAASENGLEVEYID